jgi:cation-transporting ATPase 13A1
MSTISLVRIDKKSNERALIAVKGAPETLKSMFTEVPEDYEKTYKWFAQRGSRVLALGYKWADGMNKAEVRFLPPSTKSHRELMSREVDQHHLEG